MLYQSWTGCRNLTRLRSTLYSSMHLRNKYKVLGFWSSGRKVAIFILSRSAIVNQTTPKLDPLRRVSLSVCGSPSWSVNACVNNKFKIKYNITNHNQAPKGEQDFKVFTYAMQPKISPGHSWASKAKGEEVTVINSESCYLNLAVTTLQSDSRWIS